ncbi:unnamed protein product [Calypogeia fissa]
MTSIGETSLGETNPDKFLVETSLGSQEFLGEATEEASPGSGEFPGEMSEASREFPREPSYVEFVGASLGEFIGDASSRGEASQEFLREPSHVELEFVGVKNFVQNIQEDFTLDKAVVKTIDFGLDHFEGGDGWVITRSRTRSKRSFCSTNTGTETEMVTDIVGTETEIETQIVFGRETEIVTDTIFSKIETQSDAHTCELTRGGEPDAHAKLIYERGATK